VRLLRFTSYCKTKRGDLVKRFDSIISAPSRSSILAADREQNSQWKQKRMLMKTIDAKALKILRSYCLINPAATSPEDFAYAKRAGLMFDVLELSHDEIVAWAFEEFKKSNKQSVAASFLLGLEYNEPYLRAALSAHAIMTHFPKHLYSLTEENKINCSICGVAEYGGQVKVDLTFLNRGRWLGSVIARYPQKLAFNLQQHNENFVGEPNEKGIERFCELLTLIGTSSDDETPTTLHKKIRKLPGVKMSVEEARYLLDTLGYAGILQTPEHQGFIYKYTGHLSPQKSRSSDWGYPVDFWTGKDGINLDALKFWFSDYPQIAKWKPKPISVSSPSHSHSISAALVL
jgi:hypothetical protein